MLTLWRQFRSGAAVITVLKPRPNTVGEMQPRIDNEPEIDVVRESGSGHWLGPALLAGLAYAAVGIVFGWLAGAAASHQMNFFWRWGAWAVSAAVYAAHIGYERYALRSSTGPMARHVAVAVALGGFGLAVAAGVHALSVPSRNQNLGLYALALVAWPAITAVPAFVFTLALGAVLSRLPRRA